jgi:hypothetical protein
MKIQNIEAISCNNRKKLQLFHRGPDGDAMEANFRVVSFFKKVQSSSCCGITQFQTFLTWLPGSEQLKYSKKKEKLYQVKKIRILSSLRF